MCERREGIVNRGRAGRREDLQILKRGRYCMFNGVDHSDISERTE